VFTIGYRSGPEFFASLSLLTLLQVGLALVVEATGPIIVLAFAFHLEAGTAAGLAAGSLTQSSMIGTATGALAQLDLPDDVLRQQQANVAAGYAVTYILGYTLTALFVPLAAPWLMGIDLKREAAKLEAVLSGGKPKSGAQNLIYRKFNARVYRVTTAAGETVGGVEERIGRRAIVERIVPKGSRLEPDRHTLLERADEIVVAGPSAAIIAAPAHIGPEIDGGEVLRQVSDEVLDVVVDVPALHGCALTELVTRIGDDARGIFCVT
jgi:putative transport protein